MICSNCSQQPALSALSLSLSHKTLYSYISCASGARQGGNSGLAQYCKTIGGQYLDQSGVAVTDWEAISGPMSVQDLSILIGSWDCGEVQPRPSAATEAI